MMIAEVINSSWIILGKVLLMSCALVASLPGKVAPQHFICHLWLLSERYRVRLWWHNAAKYPLWLRSATGSGSDGPGVNTDRVLPDRYLSLPLSLSDFTHPELTLGPTVEREQHIKVGIVKIFSIIMTSGSVTWFVTHCHVLRVPCHEWNDLAWLQIET